MEITMFPNGFTLIYDSNEIPDDLVFKAVSNYSVKTSLKNDLSKRCMTVSGDYKCLYSILFDLTAYLVDTNIIIF